jgi:predicted acylesterase/phospholipase RssA
MKNFGLALSGGGFRASFYHMGLIRFLHDAGILPRVTHITSVSGGSVFAAHLVLNWDRYNGSPNDFDAAAADFLSFAHIDVRNRIMRRFPLALPLYWPARLLGRSTRQLTRTGLLEYHYERYLYGDTSLFELPEKPQLHILATNLSEGCLCSFNRKGLLMVRPQPGDGIRLDHIHVGLATVPMAVTASSAFPAFFPPLELTGDDVGVSVGEFGRQAYTDGGVFDNLGVRMFRCLERPLLAETPLSRDDFDDFKTMVKVLHQAGDSTEETPLHRLGQILAAPCSQPEPLLLTGAGASSKVQLLPPPSAGGNGDADELVVSRLGDVLRHHPLQHEPRFAGLKPVHPEAESLLNTSKDSDRALDVSDQFWLNRHLLDTAYRQATGRACFRRLDSGLDGVLVSDVGKPITVQGDRRAGGIIRTSVRASSILMDRVWQLEKETFHNAPGFVFAPITEVVEPSEDPTALHPEVQRQTAGVRTDFDRFTPLEISSLVRHGYCVGRKACRAHPAVFGDELPASAPWDPIATARSAAPRISVATRLQKRPRGPAAPTAESRTLQASAFLRVWSTLLDYRDWTSYVYVPLLIPIFVLLPYLIVTYYQQSHRTNQIVRSIVQGSPEFDVINRLLGHGPDKPFTGEVAEEVRTLDEPDFKGFEILQDARILDLRTWKRSKSGMSDSSSRIYGYRRLRVLKQAENTGSNLLRMRILPTSPHTAVRHPAQEYEPKLRMSYRDSSGRDQKECDWETSYALHRLANGDFADLSVEYQSPGQFLERGPNGSAFSLEIQADTAELVMWILMPERGEYSNFRVTRHTAGKPEKVEAVKLVTEYLADDFTILAFRLLNLKAGHTYEVRWIYK